MLSKHLGSFLLCLNLLIFASLIGKSQETICGFCGKDFVVLDRHSWRCKDRSIINSVTVDNPITADNGPSTHHLQTSQRTETISHSLANTNNVIPPTNDPPEIRDEQSCNHDRDSYTCFCGRKCAGLRCTFQILGGCQGRRTEVGVTTVSNSLILGGWVTKVLKNGDKK